MKYFIDLINRPIFGVSTYLADKMNIATSRVRLYFVYSSFFTFGFSFLIYLIVAFWINIKDAVRKKYRAF